MRLEQVKRDKTCQFVIHAIILSNVKFTESVNFGFVFGREEGRGIFYFVCAAFVLFQTGEATLLFMIIFHL